MRRALSRILALSITIALVLVSSGQPASAFGPPPPPAEDAFYDYTGSAALESIAPGTVLKTRTTAAHFQTLPLPIKAVQLLYRTTSQTGEPIATATTVLQPIFAFGKPKLISYQSFYDSLTPDCQPSYALAGGFDRGLIASAESLLLVGFLLQGYTVVTSDFEGQNPAFAVGPQYGMATLDGIRAAYNSPKTGLSEATKVGMLGYSGGAIATEWATELAATYAPDVNERLVGSAIGGVFANPIRNLDYVDGSLLWSGVMPMALIGIARGFEINLTKYASEYGKKLLKDLNDACLVDAIGHYPGLTFAKLVKPQFADPTAIPELVRVINQLIMGTGGTPTVPMLIRQGTGGELEGTSGSQPGIGPGDGVMIAGDVRTLAREYCSRGVVVDHQEYPLLSHIPSAVPFFAEATLWLGQRFAGKTAPSNCGDIKPGNPVAPLPIPAG